TSSAASARAIAASSRYVTSGSAIGQLRLDSLHALVSRPVGRFLRPPFEIGLHQQVAVEHTGIAALDELFPTEANDVRRLAVAHIRFLTDDEEGGHAMARRGVRSIRDAEERSKRRPVVLPPRPASPEVRSRELQVVLVDRLADESRVRETDGTAEVAHVVDVLQPFLTQQRGYGVVLAPPGLFLGVVTDPVFHRPAHSEAAPSR